MGMNVAAAAGVGLVLLMMLLFIRWKWRGKQIARLLAKYLEFPDEQTELVCPPCPQVQLVHRLCPHHNVVQRYEVEQKDSLDEHLDVLTRKLAEKEGRLQLSKSKIRETQNEIENLHAIDATVRSRYRELMNALRGDLQSNELDCRQLQKQIEWVSRRRAELRDEVRRGHRLYGEAATELASNLVELQQGRTARVTEKPQTQQSISSLLRHRKEPFLPKASQGSIILKSPPGSHDEELMSPLATEPTQRLK